VYHNIDQTENKQSGCGALDLPAELWCAINRSLHWGMFVYVRKPS